MATVSRRGRADVPRLAARQRCEWRRGAAWRHRQAVAVFRTLPASTRLRSGEVPLFASDVSRHRRCKNEEGWPRRSEAWLGSARWGVARQGKAR